jgi:hypothetical protein
MERTERVFWGETLRIAGQMLAQSEIRPLRDGKSLPIPFVVQTTSGMRRCWIQSVTDYTGLPTQLIVTFEKDG